MPELPDVLVYLEALEPRIVNRVLRRARVLSPFVLRTFEPPIESLEGRTVLGLRRIGKRIVLCFPDELFLVLHLMIAGRLRWLAPSSTEAGRRPAGRIALARFEFPTGTLVLTEAGTKKRAALHVLRGERALAALDPGGLEVLEADEARFAAALRRGNHTLKRALTDPRLLSGIGNAYADEILHAARLSPLKRTDQLSDAEIARLFAAAQSTLRRWIDALRDRFAGRFPGPGEITAFRPDFAVHGRFGQPCPDCGTPVQRIRYAENETNYCPRCQTSGVVLADRSLSRLLREDWPRSVEDL